MGTQFFEGHFDAFVCIPCVTNSNQSHFNLFAWQAQRTYRGCRCSGAEVAASFLAVQWQSCWSELPGSTQNLCRKQASQIPVPPSQPVGDIAMAASTVSEWWILKPTLLVCKVSRMWCSLLKMGCASLVLWSMDEQRVVKLGHQSSVTGLRSRRYSLNNSWPEKDQRYFTFSTIPCSQGVPSAVFHLARLEKIWKFIGKHDYLMPKALAGYVDVCIQLWSWGISGLP